MKNIHEYYDNMADVSVATREAIESVEKAKAKIQEALFAISKCRRESDMSTPFISTNVKTVDIHRNLLFLQLSLNQFNGLTQTPEIQELLSLTNWNLSDKDEF